MKQDWSAYLGSIGITSSLKDRIEAVHSILKGFFVDEISDLFVEDYLTQDGTREYGSVWFFSAQLVSEVRQFSKSDDFDMTPIKNRIIYWTLKQQDYDFKKANEKSRLFVTFDMDTDVSGDLKATGANCDQLRKIFILHVVPNIQKLY